ncbi:glutathione hydrolase 1 proenzyme-like isoform X2 [Lethenteron reissneri]|uniref:glutathione hydrolase 1 proenzyme-like isoform X2 n=1 Tax=Lethenteron reissneri TaxID=7753 RepID=UPI002AB65FF9|nr:glutathione hydrolase 1 proenzyme-like isoform X2 [Lethenteron reissneri]
MQKLSVVVQALAVVLIAITLVCGLYFALTGDRRHGHAVVSATSLGPSNRFLNAVVTTDSGLCSDIGRDVLKEGGSAVDAAISALLCVGLTCAHSTGIGGGLFLTIYNASTGKVEAINAREVAPLNATQDMFGGDAGSSRIGGLAIAVPGEIRGYALAHRRHGRLPWARLFQPSIALARNGFRMSGPLASAVVEHRQAIEASPSLCDVFCDDHGEILQVNSTVRDERLAETLQVIAAEGPDAFYDGSLSESIVDDIRAAGGIIALEDLRAYEPELVEVPLLVELGRYRVYTPPPPASGAVLSLILNILEGFHFSADSVSTAKEKALTYHRIVEAFKFAFAKRSELADPRFADVRDLVRNLTSEDYAQALRWKISGDSTHPARFYESMFSHAEDAGASHVSVVAGDGGAVSATSSINLSFGSLVRSRTTGIIFNNAMDSFSSPFTINTSGVPPSPANYIQPAVVMDEEAQVKMVVGAAGGIRIVTSAALAIINTLWFGQDIKAAVSAPRLHHQLLPNKVIIEDGFDQAVVEGLRFRNHEVALQSPAADSVVQAIVRVGSHWRAESDHRKGGRPAGY